MDIESQKPTAITEAYISVNLLFMRTFQRTIWNFVVGIIFMIIASLNKGKPCERTVIGTTFTEIVEPFGIMAILFMSVIILAYALKKFNKWREISKKIYIAVFYINNVILSILITVVYWKGSFNCNEESGIFISGIIFTIYLVIGLIHDIFYLGKVLLIK